MDNNEYYFGKRMWIPNNIDDYSDPDFDLRQEWTESK